MEDYELPEESIVFDRNGTELARFGEFKREVVEFEEIPPILLDATTAIEDKTFWENAGFDPVAIFSAGLDSLRGRGRGASTVTQQLTRMRLLEDDLLQDPGRLAERKLKEIIQSIRLTQHYAGEPGKQDIITAYLNQIYYGNQSYGVKAAARSYFGVNDLSELTPAQAAVLAALPKSPSNYDLVRNAVEECLEPGENEGECAKSQLVVPPDTTVVERRNQILTLMAEDGRTPMSDGQYTAEELLAARDEPVVLVPQTTERWQAPHFVWRVRDELATKLCGEDATCPQLDHGGLRITTTLDLDVQKTAEKWVKAAAVVPFQDNPRRAAERLGLKYEDWMAQPGRQAAAQRRPRRDGLPDRRADRLCRERRLLLDQAQQALPAEVRRRREWLPPAGFGVQAVQLRDRDRLGQAHRGHRAHGRRHRLRQRLHAQRRRPPRARTAHRPKRTAVLAQHPVGQGDAGQRPGNGLRARAGIRAALPGRLEQCRPVAGARHPGDAAGRPRRPGYATIANGGRYIGNTTILTVKDRSGEDVVDPYEPPEPTQVISPQAAYITTSILAGNTNRNVNPFWGKFALRGPDGERRPATLKTGTNNDAKDLNAYGYIAPPTREQREDGEYALVVGAWNGNSDNSEVSTPNNPLFSVDVATYVWQGFLQETTKDWPIRNFRRPEEGLVRVEIDPFTGYLPQRGSRGLRGMVHRGHRAQEPAAARSVRARGPRAPGLRVEVRQLAGVGPRLAAPCAAWAGRGGRSRPNARHLLLQQRLQSLRPQMGPGHGPGLCRTDACPLLRPAAEAGCQWRDPVVRAPGAVRRCAGACLLPARIGDAGAECAAQRGAVAATRTHARTRADADAGTGPDANARADPHRQPGAGKAALVRHQP